MSYQKKEKIDFSSIDYRAILEKYNIKNIGHRAGDEIQFSCPFPSHRRGDIRPSSSLNVNKGTVHCFGCGFSGNIIDWICAVDGVDKSVALSWLATDFSGRFTNNLVEKLQDAIRPKSVSKKIKIPELYLANFSVDWDIVFDSIEAGEKVPKIFRFFPDRGLTKETLKEYQFGFDKSYGRITIPIRDEDKNLIGFKARSIKDEPKYIILGDKKKPKYGFSPYKVGDYVYFVYDIEPKWVIIVEGEIDAIKLRQQGFNAVSLGGSNPTRRQMSILLRKIESAILLLDPDEAGHKAERKLVENLNPHIPLKVAKLPSGIDPADANCDILVEVINKATSPLQVKTS